IMREMGWSEYHAKRVFGTERYFPTFEDLPKFCNVAGNTIIVQWLQVHALLYGIEPKHQNVDCAELVKRIGDLFGEMSDVGQEASDSIRDGILEPKELRRIIRELNDVVSKSMTLIGDLRALERSLKEGGGCHA
ncbi:MAG: phage regulatory CII family protein, partial [Halodesulfovibrio sp.]